MSRATVKKAEAEAAAEAAEEAALHPRRAAVLRGARHGAAIERINPAAAGTSRAHQSFIFSGPRGIGKATAAYALARQVFADETIPLIAAASHPDLLTIEPAPDRASKTITVEQIREMSRFLAHHPARGKWRMVIVDALDAVNFNGANAMLKTLEEPPAHSLIVLIHHATKRVLPTIRSRCRMVRFAPLAHEETAALVAGMFPDADSAWVEMAGILAAGAPGRVRLFAESGAVDLYGETCALLAGEGASLAVMENIAAQWGAGGGANLARRQSALILFSRLLVQSVRRGAGIDSGDVRLLDAEEHAITALLARHAPVQLAQMYSALMGDCAEAEVYNTDQGIIFFNFLHALASAERGAAA